MQTAKCTFVHYFVSPNYNSITDRRQKLPNLLTSILLLSDCGQRMNKWNNSPRTVIIVSVVTFQSPFENLLKRIMVQSQTKILIHYPIPRMSVVSKWLCEVSRRDDVNNVF